jgi:hypothetical protein
MLPPKGRRGGWPDSGEKKISYFQKLTATAPGADKMYVRQYMRWYYRKIRWVNSTEDP